MHADVAAEVGGAARGKQALYLRRLVLADPFSRGGRGGETVEESALFRLLRLQTALLARSLEGPEAPPALCEALDSLRLLCLEKDEATTRPVGEALLAPVQAMLGRGGAAVPARGALGAAYLALLASFRWGAENAAPEVRERRHFVAADVWSHMTPKARSRAALVQQTAVATAKRLGDVGVTSRKALADAAAARLPLAQALVRGPLCVGEVRWAWLPGYVALCVKLGQPLEAERALDTAQDAAETEGATCDVMGALSQARAAVERVRAPVLW